MIGLGALRARLRRRLLISYRVDPVVAAGLIPAPFRPQLVDGSAGSGVCIIGLQAIRPGWIRPEVGLASENVAHRIAVEWDEGGETRRGVYIFGRHTSSPLPVLAGGRLFPRVHEHARIELDETADRFRIRIRAAGLGLRVDARAGGPWASTLFPTLEAASEFYRGGPVGWSPTRDGRGVEPVELRTEQWAVEPARIDAIESSFFDALPTGSAQLDSVVLMRGLPLVWTVPAISASPGRARTPSVVRAWV